MKKMKRTGSRFLVGLVTAVMLLSVAVPAMAFRITAVYYPDNTVCSFGPYFRYVSDPLTDKAYTFTPLDLSKDGTQSYMLIAGNKRIIGDVAVTVEGDAVTVTCSYKDNVWPGSQFFTVFKDYDSITAADLEQTSSPFEYGKAFSIKDDLEGDTDVLLYVLNKATYKIMPYHLRRPLPMEDEVLKTYYFTAYTAERLEMAEMAGIADRYTEPELYVRPAAKF